MKLLLIASLITLNLYQALASQQTKQAQASHTPLALVNEVILDQYNADLAKVAKATIDLIEDDNSYSVYMFCEPETLLRITKGWTNEAYVNSLIESCDRLNFGYTKTNFKGCAQ